MASSWFSSKVNLSTIVSQGLEHVTKLKDDVEKQFDEAVSGKGMTTLTLQNLPPATIDMQAPPNLFQENVPSTALAPSPAPPQDEESSPLQSTDTCVDPDCHRESDIPPALQCATLLSSTSSAGDSPTDSVLLAAHISCPPPSEPCQQAHGPSHETPPSSLLPRAEEDVAPTGWDASLDDLHPDAAENSALLAIVQTLPPNVASDPSTSPITVETSPPVDPSSTTLDSSNEFTDIRSDLPSSDGSIQPTTTAVVPSIESVSQDNRSSPSPPASSSSSLHATEDAPPTSIEVLFLQKELAHVQAELQKSRDVLCERESQLVSTSAAMAKLHEELEALRSARSTTSPNDASVIYSLQVALADKEMQLTNLLDEGEALSKKQAAFESRLRALRKEKTDIMDENKKLTAALETATAKWETARMHLVTAEEDAKLHAHVLKSLDATDAKLQATEAALIASTQRLTATEALVEQLGAENDALKARTQLAAFEDREALEATIAELQANVAQVEAEASKREDQARVALHAMKQRWQEAVTRMDHMTHSTSDATQPLLRQIQLLQEEQRVLELRRMSFEADMQKKVDNAAREVAMVQAELAVETKNAMDAQTRASVLLGQVTELQGLVQAEKVTVESLHKQLDDSARIRQQLEQQLEVLGDEKRHLATRLRLVQEQHDVHTKQLLHQLEQQTQDAAALRRQLHEATTPTSTPITGTFASAATLPPSAPMPLPQAPILQESPQSGSSCRRMDRTPSSDLNEDMSMIEWNQLLQKVRLRESEASLLKSQLQTVEEARKSASDDVVRLSTQNAALKAAVAELAATKEALAAMEVKQHVLLELLGEKDEQVEELEAEFREFKQMYQNQIDTLTRR
ncbi:hypothetical protein, variant 1 [Aphanomyces invadans]|uniref:TATA element modulatory factor 1 TATA binding domain-containing protein n=1 Tax=Aphanomyces invadans TaxID=157072 RepID=A0A024U8K7_9STRA|nr:hypothetical protein, variant 1 [Aphanomyces invadans]ETW02614.1 hypothetical protein, variant 1 [Aphanomyces invadans]|eukprot:XP_008869219.1 hypothetical protein, variant 1 [Aphanomyces invadans]